MNIYVTYGALMFVIVLVFKNTNVITDDVYLVLLLVSLTLQICGI